jgi:hypothetical protein
MRPAAAARTVGRTAASAARPPERAVSTEARRAGPRRRAGHHRALR